MYTMKEACEMTGLSYETLKFYCNQGLIPDLQRDKSNRRIFAEHQIHWIRGLLCLRDCGMGVGEMKEYFRILLAENPDIPALKAMLECKREALEETVRQAQESMKFIQWKQNFYDAVMAGEIGLFDAKPPEGGMEQVLAQDELSF